MLFKIKRWLAPPNFPEDNEKTAKGRIINKMGLLLVLTLLITAFILIPFFINYKLIAWTITLGLLMIYGISRYLLFRGKLEFSVILTISSVWFISTGISLLGGGISCPMLFIVMASTIYIGFLLKPRIGSIYVLVSIFIVLGLAILQYNHFSLPQIFTFSPLTSWFMFVLALLFIHFPLKLIIQNLSDALKRERQQSKRLLKTEATLRESERYYRSLVSQMLNGFALHEIICDEYGIPWDYRFLEVNSAFEELTGLSRTEIIDKTVLEILPNIEPYWIETYGKVALTGTPTRFEYYTQVLNKHFEVLAYCPQERQFVTVFTDITKRKQADKTLQESERKFKSIAENIPGMVYQWRVRSNGSSYFSYISPYITKMFELPADLKNSDLNIGMLTHPENRESFLAAVSQSTEKKKNLDYEWKFITPSREEKWAHAIASPTQIKDELMYDGVILDITKQKNAEELLMSYSERLATLYKSNRAILTADSLDAIVQAALDHLWGLVPCEYVWVMEVDLKERMTQYIAGQLRSREIFQQKDKEPLINNWQIELLKQQDFVTINNCTHFNHDIIINNLIQKHKSCTIYFFRLMAEKQIIGCLGVALVDVNKLSTEEIEILRGIANSLAIALFQKKMHTQIKEDAQFKTDLLREVNHRVSNNFLAIKGLLQIEIQNTSHQYADIINDKINRLSQRVDGLIEVHKMLSQSQWMPLNLTQLASHIVKISLSALPSNQKIDAHITPSDITISPKQANNLALMLNELTTNTIKYGMSQAGLKSRTQGHINIHITEIEKRKIKLEFCDDGPGYPEPVLQFNDIDIGLYLIQQLAIAMEGELTLSNKDGARTTLVFSQEKNTA